MPVDFGLLQSAGRIPMQAQAAPTPDIMQGMQQAQKVAVGQEQVQQAQASMQDRAALQQYLQSGGDIYTPPGVEKAMADLKGKVSPDLYLKLGDQSRKLKEADLTLKEHMTKLNTEQVSAYQQSLERTLPAIESLSQGYEKVKSEKGEQEASAWFQQNRGQLIEQMKGQQAGPGVPLFNPQVLQNLGQMNPEQLPGLVKGSAYAADQVKQRLEAAKASEAEAKAAIYKSTGSLKPGSTDLYEDDKGNKYSVTRFSNGDVKVMRNGKDAIGFDDLPAGVKKIGTKAASDAASAGLLKPETLAFAAEYQQMTGKPIPVPAFGAANNRARAEYLNAFADLARSKGYDGTEAGSIALQREASKEALKRITTQDAAIDTGERDIKNVMVQLKDELKKLGGPDSPIVRKYWSKGATEWMGSPEFVGIKSKMANIKEIAARVYSGASGAGGTPVGYLKLLDDVINENYTIEQVSKLDETLTSQFDSRKKATDSVKSDLINAVKMPTKPGSAAANPKLTDEMRAANAVSPEDQKARDVEAAGIIKSEYDASVAAIKAAKNPKDRQEAILDMQALRRQLKRKGVDVPDVTVAQEAAPAAAAPKKYSKLWE
jgi:hypothetical protein